MSSHIVNLLRKGKIGVMPTDTIYGIVGSALNPKTVEKIYKLRKRSKKKPFIILISSLNDLKKFDVTLTKEQENFLKKIWPNPVSVVLPTGTKSLAFRMPKNKKLLELLRAVGPLVAPSANIAGAKPAQTIDQAKQYFGDSVFYVDGGEITSKPSALIEFSDTGVKVLRPGLMFSKA